MSSKKAEIVRLPENLREAVSYASLHYGCSKNALFTEAAWAIVRACPDPEGRRVATAIAAGELTRAEIREARLRVLRLALSSRFDQLVGGLPLD